MKLKKIWAVSFSPTGGTKKITDLIAKTMAETLQIPMEIASLTLPEERKSVCSFSREDLLILGVPVYAGRVPNKILPDLERILTGDQTVAIPVSVYGNRSFGDTLLELNLLLQHRGFRTAAAAAVVSRHAFSKTLAADRPDEADCEKIRLFAWDAAKKLKEGNWRENITIPGSQTVGAYYIPLKEDGTPAVFLKAKPVTDLKRCDNCGRCAVVCPMGSIAKEAPSLTTGICIKCQACIHRCPKQARSFDNSDFLSHVSMLERTYHNRKDSVFYL